MNKNIDKLVDELEEFKRSIRHLPQSEQQRLIKDECNRRNQKRITTKKIYSIGFIFLLPLLVLFFTHWYYNTVYVNFRAIILTMLLSPFSMLMAEIYFKKAYLKKKQ